eukprot:251819_1
MAVIIGLTGRFKLADNGDQDFILVNHEATRTMNGLALAEGIAFGDTVSADSLQQIRSSQIDEWRFILMFRSAEGNNLFTPENVAVMRNIENFILTPEWEKLCWSGFSNESNPNPQADLQPPCDPSAHMSLLPFFGDGSQVSISNGLANAAGWTSNSTLRSLVGNDFSCDSLSTASSRSIFLFGAPLAGDSNGSPFRNSLDRFDGQESVFLDFMIPIQKFLQEQSTDTMDVLFFSDSGISILFNEAVSSDFLWSLVSMVIVFGIMTLHTGSFVLSGATMLEIYMSMPFAFFIFNIVFRVEFVQEIHFLTIFVLLGIGADDAFVFTDAWNQAIVEIPVLARYENMHLRMAWTHSRASKTMLITSITTSVAFFATAISGIIPIASFGIFAGCLILCNYALVCTYFPAVLVLYERNCNGKRCCKRSKSVEPLST